MLQLAENRSRKSTRSRLAFIATTALLSLLLVSGSIYTLALYAAPSYMHYFDEPRLVDAQSLPSPRDNDNRIIIPKLSINISYGPSPDTLRSGGAWLNANGGTPGDADVIMIGAQRLAIRTTPGQTVLASPFYHLNQLSAGDQIILDYKGKRYGYTVEKPYSQTSLAEISRSATDGMLLLYTAKSDGADDTATVIAATPLGEVTVETTSSSDAN